jgi:hypothetical protein
MAANRMELSVCLLHLTTIYDDVDSNAHHSVRSESLPRYRHIEPRLWCSHGAGSLLDGLASPTASAANECETRTLRATRRRPEPGLHGERPFDGGLLISHSIILAAERSRLSSGNGNLVIAMRREQSEIVSVFKHFKWRWWSSSAAGVGPAD